MKTAMNPSDIEKLCDPQKLLQYFDDELPAGERRRMAGHLEHCGDCRGVLRRQQHLRRTVQKAADTITAQLPRPDVEGRLLDRIAGKRPPKRSRSGIWAPGRLIPMGAVTAALVVVGMVYNQRQAVVRTAEPSAIVESFHGNVSTVMILETQTTGQTIVWFNELSEPNGESDGNQSTPPAVDRSAYPAADEQRGLGRA